MTKRLTLILTSAGLAIALGAGLALAPRASGAEADEAAVKQQTAAFVAAWAKHDPKAIAALWADDGDLLNPWGRWAKGRADVEKLFTDEQTGQGPLRDSVFSLTGESVRFPSADVAVDDWEVSVSGAYDPDGTKHATPMTFHNTVVRKKTGGAWLVHSARPYLTATQPK